MNYEVVFIQVDVNVIPQEPFFLPRTLRFNIDCGSTTGPISDACLIKRLTVKRPQSAAFDFEVGEHQLLVWYMGWVIKRSVLDEATSRYTGISDYSPDDIVDSCYILMWTRNRT